MKRTCYTLVFATVAVGFALVPAMSQEGKPSPTITLQEFFNFLQEHIGDDDLKPLANKENEIIEGYATPEEGLPDIFAWDVDGDVAVIFSSTCESSKPRKCYTSEKDRPRGSRLEERWCDTAITNTDGTNDDLVHYDLWSGSRRVCTAGPIKCDDSYVPGSVELCDGVVKPGNGP